MIHAEGTGFIGVLNAVFSNTEDTLQFNFSPLCNFALVLFGDSHRQMFN